MKIVYEKPGFEIEEYELTAAIATGCSVIITMGPDEGCPEYAQPYAVRRSASEPTSVPFSTEYSCSCYPSASGSTLMTS